MSSHHHPGNHELGQNFLTDRGVIRAVVELTAGTRGPVVEWAAGDGALTLPLGGLGRPLVAVEIDPRKAARLARRVGPHVCVTEGDILRHAPPKDTSTIVSNIPFHITTPVLRHLLALPRWETAILITQWEVARKRAGVGGATQLTAQWWPWFDFALQRRIPSTAFTPRPSVDAGLLLIRRRPLPLVSSDPQTYRDWVRRVFTGRGRGLPEILARAGGIPPRAVSVWRTEHGVPPRTLPRDLTAEQWADLYALSTASR